MMDDVQEAAEIFGEVKKLVPDSVCAAIVTLGVYVGRRQSAVLSDRFEQLHEILETMNDTMIGQSEKVCHTLDDVVTTLGDIDMTVTETHKALTRNFGVDSG